MMMRNALLAMAIVGPASAAELTIVDACTRAADHYWNVEGVEATRVQSFPELSPPRVRLYAMVPKRPVESGFIECRFSRAAKPFGLTSFCPPDGCILVNKERLEEIQTLLDREGY